MPCSVLRPLKRALLIVSMTVGQYLTPCPDAHVPQTAIDGRLVDLLATSHLRYPTHLAE